MAQSTRMCTRCGKTRLRAGNPEQVCGPCARAEANAADFFALPVEFWFRPAIATACSQWDLGTIVRNLLDETGITEQRLGELIGRSQAQVWRIANHRSECHDIRVIKAICDVFGCPPLLLGLAPAGGEMVAKVSPADSVRGEVKGEEDATDRREFIIWGAAGLTGLPVADRDLAPPDVRRLRGIVRELYDQDDRRGGGVVADVAYRHFQRALHALSSGRHTGRKMRQELEAVTSELGESAGWFAFDSERHAMARACFTEALCIADMAGDERQAVHVLASMSLQCTYRGRSREAVQLARYATRRALPWAPPRVLSMLSVREARGWARMGDESQFRKAIIAAKRYFDRGEHEDDPSWLWYFDNAHVLLGDEAFGWADLGRYRRAEDYIRAELGQRDARYGRERALSCARLVEVVLAQGRVKEAGRIAADSLLPSLKEVTSVRVLGKARTLRHRFEPHRERHCAVDDFVHAFDRLNGATR